MEGLTASEQPVDRGAAAAPDGGIELRGISKRFGGIRAVESASISIARGTVHALVGENGAGKSTIGKVIAGVHRPDAGALYVDGRRVSYASPQAALADGIAAVSQELALVPARSVVENVFLARERARAGVVRASELERRFEKLMKRLQFDLPAYASVADLSLADRQKVELARAVTRDAWLIVMDEPTAAMSAGETARLLETIRKLVAAGTTIVFVSHFLGEVLEIADEVTVMRDGRVVHTRPAHAESADSLVRAMLGRSIEQAFPPQSPATSKSSPLLSIEGLSRRGHFEDVSLSVGAGEVVGLAGLVGSGRTELARAAFGLERCDAGVVRVAGRVLGRGGPRTAIRAGLQMVPEDRKRDGLVMGRSVRENITLGDLRAISRGSVIGGARERAGAGELVRQVDIRPATPDTLVSALSGGNQQKVLFAKCLFTRPRVLIADEPTRGVDVGAKRVIYDLLVALADDGLGILLISSEFEELVALSHRVAVMRRGRLVADLTGADISEERVMAAAFGADRRDVAA